MSSTYSHSCNSCNVENNNSMKLPMIPSEILGHIASYFKENDLTTLMQCGDSLLRSKLKIHAKHMVLQVVPYVSGISSIGPIVQFERLTSLKIHGASTTSTAPSDFANNGSVVDQLIVSGKLSSLTRLDVQFSNTWEGSKWNQLIIDSVMPNLLHLRVDNSCSAEDNYLNSFDFFKYLPKNIQTLLILRQARFSSSTVTDVALDMSHLTNLVEFMHYGLCIRMGDKVRLPPNLETLHLYWTTTNIFKFTPPTLTCATFDKLNPISYDADDSIVHLPGSLKKFGLYERLRRFTSIYIDGVVLQIPSPSSLTNLCDPTSVAKYSIPSSVRHLESCYWDPVSDQSHRELQLLSLKNPCNIQRLYEGPNSSLLPSSLTSFQTDVVMVQSRFVKFFQDSLPNLTSLIVPKCEVFVEQIPLLSSSLQHLSITIISHCLGPYNIVWPKLISERLQTLVLTVGRVDDDQSQDGFGFDTLDIPINLKSLDLISTWTSLYVTSVPSSLTHLDMTVNVSLDYKPIAASTDLTRIVLRDCSRVVNPDYKPTNLMHSHITSLICHGFPSSLDSMVLGTDPSCKVAVSIRSLFSALPLGMRSFYQGGEGMLFSALDADLFEMLHFIPQTLVNLHLSLKDRDLLPWGNSRLFQHRQFCKQDNCDEQPENRRMCSHRSLLVFSVNGTSVTF